MQIGKHIFETSGSKTGDAEADKKWALQRLEEGWNTFDLIVYTDGSATSGTGTGGGGYVVTTVHPSDPQVLRYFAILTGKWCSSYQAEIKAVVRISGNRCQTSQTFHNPNPYYTNSLSLIAHQQQQQSPSPPSPSSSPPSPSSSSLLHHHHHHSTLIVSAILSFSIVSNFSLA